jgi:hypothetical protein
LLTLAKHENSRECLLLLESILETPGLMPRLSEVLRPADGKLDDASVKTVGQAKSPKKSNGRLAKKRTGLRG